MKPQGTGLRPAPENKGTADLVPGGTIVTVTGQKGNWLRIVLDDGREGFSQRFLLDPVVGTPGPAAQAAQVAQAPEATEVELAVWNSVKDTTLPAELEAYLAIYPNGVFAPLARIRLGALRGTPNAEAAARDKRRVTGRPKRRVTGRPKRRVTGRQDWPRARLAFSQGKFVIADFEIGTIQNMHLDNYRLTGPAQSAFISHYRVRDGQIWVDGIDDIRVAVEILNSTYSVNFSPSDIERRNNGYGRAYLGFAVIDSWYCGFLVQDFDNDTERIYGEVCIGAQASAPQKSVLAGDVREMVDGIRRP